MKLTHYDSSKTKNFLQSFSSLLVEKNSIVILKYMLFISYKKLYFLLSYRNPFMITDCLTRDTRFGDSGKDIIE